MVIYKVLEIKLIDENNLGTTKKLNYYFTKLKNNFR
ncbi:hypothetical protein Mefer_0887 [Methanocaldococcus fervens AG86]|uniref:Uncharacterized protein n=1 Tax=Methanocaldococcus fervens (strain DSM 4213 / JCM 15782 / AG86) TaxID=573064 RepID=C7P823_METFA|nr:hypothetical protein Mefer_0887 [Methanocaldococcus fervens AG86]